MVSEIWSHRNRIIFKGGVLDYSEIFSLAQLKVVDFSRQVYRIICNIILFKVRMSNPQGTILIKMFCYKTHKV